MYKPLLIYKYEHSGTQLPIDLWVRVVGKKLPEFQDDNDIYCPIPIQIKMAGNLNDPTGSVRLSISPTSPKWYEELVNVVSDMVKEKNVQIVNYLGQSIKDLKPQQLVNVGECDIINPKGKLVRIEKVVSPPLSMSSNKIGELRNWWKTNKLSDKIALQLKGLNMHEIAVATKFGGGVQKTIKNYLESNTLHNLEWDQFLSTYGNGRTSLDHLSNKLLDAVRQSLIANEEIIKTHNAIQSVDGNALWKKTPSNSVASHYKDDYTLYRDIVEDAVFHPRVSQQLIQGILYGTTTNQEQKKPVKAVEKNTFHPIRSYYHDIHYKIYGKLPGHFIETLNKKVEGNNYPGNAETAMDMFHLFSGRSLVGNFFNKKKKKKKSPSRSRSRSPIRRLRDWAKSKSRSRSTSKSPIRRLRDWARSKSRSRSRSKSPDYNDDTDYTNSAIPPMPKLVPIDQELPKLVPIDQELVSCHHGKYKKKVVVPRDEDLNEPIWVDDLPNIADFLLKK